MRTIILLSWLLATSTFANIIARNQLQVGDVILLPLNCWVCQLIEQETNSPYSHSAVVITIDKPNITVAQALGTVHSLKLNLFLQMRDPNRSVLVVRHKELQESPILSGQALAVFKNQFAGLPFDHDYLWNNYTAQGDEQMYCSEFITKFINHFLNNPINPKPMSYELYHQQWINYFGKEPPHGKLGVAPATFEHSEDFIKVGTLN